MKVVESLTDLEWFANVGQPLSGSFKDVIPVSDWREAVESCSDPSWEDACIEARSDLTMHLNAVCKAEFQDWNEVINRAKRDLAEPWKRMRSKIDSEGLPQIVSQCVEWDTMNAVAAEHYAQWKTPQFFEYLLTIYLRGRFPCGWVGRWPEGSLRVF